jgi:AcrR family transcriptional regulator
MQTVAVRFGFTTMALYRYFPSKETLLDAIVGAAVGADLGRAIGDPRFPRFAAILTAPSDGKPRTSEESFDFGLQRVLDGIELYIESMT